MPRKRTVIACVVAGPLAAQALEEAARAGDFATRVLDYTPAPGQFVNSAVFNDPARALGAPVGGGTRQQDNTKVVTLGGFGGSITLGFDAPVFDDPRNPMGLDCIVFGNAFWQFGDPTLRMAEAAVLEISVDANGNGLADDAWFVIRGSSLPAVPADALATAQWDDDAGTATAPANLAWYPAGAPSAYATTGYDLPGAFDPLVLDHPQGAGATVEVHWGYGECSPTLLLGDLSGADGSPGDDSLGDPEDDPGITPADFYTRPDDPLTVGVDARSAGGDAFDIAWAVDPATGAPAGLDRFDFLRISAGVAALRGPFGEASPEIGGVADVRALGDLNGDDVVDGADLGLLLGAWGTAAVGADLNGDGVVDGADLGLLLGAWG
ncbi:MAG: hypothetical protein ACF8QF_05980 [Phycisphaerales bacterium]